MRRNYRMLKKRWPQGSQRWAVNQNTARSVLESDLGPLDVKYRRKPECYAQEQAKRINNLTIR
jgi:hypothetical protein